MKANVVSVIVPNPNGGNITYTVQQYTSTFSDKLLKEKSDLPKIIVYFPTTPEENLTFTDKLVTGEIILEVHCQNSLGTTKLHDLIRKTLKDNKAVLAAVKISEVKVIDVDNDNNELEGFNDHWANMTVSFEYDYIDGN